MHIFRSVAISSACLLLLGASRAAYSATQQNAFLNNRGVHEMNSGRVREAIVVFEQILRDDPSYSYAIGNLAIAFNNYALKLPAERAIPYFRKSLEISPSEQTQENLNRALASLKKHKSKEQSSADDVLLLKTDCPKIVHNGKPHDKASPVVGEFGPYMEKLQSAIKKCWHPNNASSTERTVVTFKVAQDGGLSALKIHTSSGDPLMDKAALNAVTMAAPFAKLPSTKDPTVDILFTFDYNHFGGQRGGSDYDQPWSREYDRAKEHITKARQLAAAKKWDEAIESGEAAMKLYPDCREFSVPTAQFIIDEVVHSKFDNEKNIELLHRALQLDSSNAQARLALDGCLKKTGVDPQSFDQRLAYARKLKEQGKLDAALLELNLCLRLKDDNEVRKEIAAIYVKRNAIELVDRWTKAVKIQSNAENHTGLGGAFELTGDKDFATQEYNTALQLDPSYIPARLALKRLAESDAAAAAAPKATP